MTVNDILGKLEEVSMLSFGFDELDEAGWKDFRAQMGDLLRALGGSKRDVVIKARQQVAQALMKLSPTDTASHVAFMEKLEALKAVLPAKKPQQAPPAPADDSDEEIFREYLAELGEFIEQLEQEVLALEANPGNAEHIHAVFRLFHTIKGTAGVMEHHRLSHIAHQTEDLLSEVRDGNRKLESADLLLAPLDVIKSIHAGFSMKQREEQVNEAAYSRALGRLEKAMKSPQAPPPTVETPPAAPQEHIPEAEPVVEPEAQEPAVSQPDLLVEEEQPESAGEPAAAAQAHESTVRVDTRKLDGLIDLVGELVITANLVREDETTRHNGNLALRKKVAQLTGVVADLQRNSMALRMIPIGSMLQRMIRIVRDMSTHGGKSIALKIEGKETEIDRTIVDRLYEPLVHLVRNSCDHGIEPETERRAAGKPPQGTVLLKAAHQGNNILIDISDDGRGLNLDAIRRKARERGLLREGDQVADEDVWRYILYPGFSTAATVTDISGRGVGMDVVNQAIKDLGGHLEATTQQGRGCSFRISMPLTMAIMEGMMVRTGGELYVLPVMNVKRIIHPSADDINEVMGRGELVRDGERLIPVVRLHRVFRLPAAERDIEHAVMIIVSSLRREFALMVDELVDIQDVVVKTLGPKFRDLPGISGSTILGNGNVGLILDINNLYGDEA